MIVCPICDKLVSQDKGQKKTYHKECKNILDNECQKIRENLSGIAIENIKKKI